MLYLIRFAEIGKEPLKGKRKAQKDLLKTLKLKIKKSEVKVIDKGRIMLETSKDATACLKKIHGISSFSPVIKCSLKDLKPKVLAFAREKLKKAKSFAVKLKRVGRHAKTSQQMAGELGGLILKELPKKKVDLKRPGEMIFVEVRGRTCYIFNQIIPGLIKLKKRAGRGKPKALPRFIVDDMLGKLARRLRMLGYDATYYGDSADSFLLRRSKEEGRLLLTRDTGIIKVRGAQALLLTKNDLEGQLKELIKKLRLRVRPELLFSRCTICNSKVTKINKEKVKHLIPPIVYKSFNEFNYCKNCKKVFWKGTHCERLIQQFARI